MSFFHGVTTSIVNDGPRTISLPSSSIIGLVDTFVAATGPLAELLEMADLVSPQEMPPDVATMRSRLLLEELPSGTQRTYTLCYPEDADPVRGDLSVLSPAGASLLGLTVGSEARWQSLDGQHHAVRLLEILYQPEAAGEWAR